MTLWTFLIVAVIVVIGLPAIAGIVSEYKLAKIKATDSAEEVAALKNELRKFRKRLENLEAIAAADPDGFEKNARASTSGHQDFDDENGENHARQIENILERRRTN